MGERLQDAYAPQLSKGPRSIESLIAELPGSRTAEDRSEPLREARALRAGGEPQRAAACLERALRRGAWKDSRLWWELVSLMETPEDYRRIRKLWTTAAGGCTKALSIMRAVARAACVAGEHDEAQLLLRRAILLASCRARARGMRARIAALLRRRSKKTKRAEDVRSFEARAAEALKDLNAAFESLGVRAFLISGTLLGFLRDGGIIGWDKDIDVGLFSENCPEDMNRLFEGLSGFNVRRVDLTSDRLRLNHENCVGIDVFPHYLEEGLRWHDGAATRWWNTPFDLKTVRFLGIDQSIPDDPERYLDENYGNWRVPEPNFDARLDAPNAQITDRQYFDSLLYFSLLNAIRRGKTVMRDRYIGLLAQKEPAGWLARL